MHSLHHPIKNGNRMRVLYSRHLEHFLAIYEAQGLRQAAAKCGVTQPALSKSLHLLESAYGMTLFERTANGVVPTAAGQILKRHAQHMVNSARYASMEIAAISAGQSGQLRIGAGIVWGLMMPAVLAELHAEFPLLEVTLETGIGSNLINKLLSGHLDVVLARTPTDPLPSGFTIFELKTVPNIVLSRKDHPLQCGRKIGLRELCKFDFAAFANDHEYAARLRTFFDNHGMPVPRVYMKVSAVEALLAIVAKSDSLAIVPDVEIKAVEVNHLKRIPLATPFWNVRAAICYRTQITEMAPMRALLDAVRKKASQLVLPRSSVDQSRVHGRAPRALRKV
jgi:DNA-binding transcriptional LysR family regulator